MVRSAWGQQEQPQRQPQPQPPRQPAAPGQPVGRRHVAGGNRYRLVQWPGIAHHILDDLYDTLDAAWNDALSWWQGQGGDAAAPCGIGIEVSTPQGEWRTLRLPGCHSVRGHSCSLIRGSERGL